jgi:hypothetical protein
MHTGICITCIRNRCRCICTPVYTQPASELDADAYAHLYVYTKPASGIDADAYAHLYVYTKPASEIDADAHTHLYIQNPHQE